MYIPRPRPWCSPPRSSFLSLLWIILCIPCVLSLAQDAGTRTFNLPADNAEKTLKAFSQQSGHGMVVATATMKGVRTNAVRGEFTARDALNQMLRGTGLIATHDERSSGFTITRASEHSTAETPPEPAPGGETRQFEKKNDIQKPQTEDPMKRNRLFTAMAAALALLIEPVRAQTAPAAGAAETPPAGAKEEVIQLSPFQVSTTSDVGYAARETLAGTRLNTSLKDVPGQITVMTPEFLQDLAITDLNSALFYSLNTESDAETIDVSAINVAGSYTTESPVGGIGPAVGGRTRGIGPPNRAHDFFDTVVPIDAYNTERFTFASGPNSILFGNAQPSGTIDTTFKRAMTGQARRTVELRFDDIGSSRVSVDLNQPLKKDLLALRIAALRNRGEDWREPGFDRSDRVYTALTYKPLKQLELRGYYENSRFHAQVPLGSLVQDHVTPWIQAGSPAFNNISPPAALPPRTGVFVNTPANFTYYSFDAAGSFQPSYQRLTNLARTAGFDSILPPPYNTERSVTDESLYPYDVNWQGNGNQSKANSSIGGVIIEYNPLKNLFIEAGYNVERFEQRYARFMNIGLSELYVDPNLYLQDRATPNPNYGRYFFASNFSRAGRTRSTRDQRRLSVSYELDLADRPGWQRWLGRHRFAALFDRNESETFNQRSDFKILNGAQGNSNAFAFRYYIDPGDPESMSIQVPFDPLAERVHTLPGTDVQLRAWDPAGSATPAIVNRSIVQSRAFSWQGFLFNGHLALNYGRRQDDVDVFDSAGDIRRDLLTIIGDPQWSHLTSKKPETELKSVMLHTWPWLSLFYTESNTEQVPNVVRRDLDGTLALIGAGEGREYGLSLRFFDDRISIRAAKYENSGRGNVSGLRVQSPLPAAQGYGRLIRHDAMKLEHNALRQAEALGRDIFSDKYRVLQEAILASTDPNQAPGSTILDVYDFLSDSEAEGYELTIVGNPTRNWRLSLGAAKNEATESNIGTGYLDFINERLPVWIDPAWRNEFTNVPNSGARITALRAAQMAIQNFDYVYRQEGQKARNLREYRVNATARYAFSSGPLKGFFVGGNYNWRSPLVSGYKWTSPEVPNRFIIPGVLEPATLLMPDINQPVYGSPLITFDGFAGYTRRIFKDRVTWRIQLNVRNLLNDTDLIHQLADPDGMFVISAPKQPRSFIITNTFSF